MSFACDLWMLERERPEKEFDAENNDVGTFQTLSYFLSLILKRGLNFRISAKSNAKSLFNFQ